MTPVKPCIAPAETLNILNEVFAHPISGLASVEDGQIAQTFTFTVLNDEYFIQFNHSNMSQAKTTEAFYTDIIKELDIPIRLVVSSGIIAGLQYTVSRKVQGVPLTSLSDDAFLSALPNVIDTLLRISKVDTGSTFGYGWLDANCHGKFDSWAAHLSGIMDEIPGDFYGFWHELFNTTFLDKSKFDHFYKLMTDLLQFVPETRNLIHGDYGYGNVFMQKGTVSAILDWQNSRYGDPVFDLAYMLFWRNGTPASMD